MSNRSWDKAVCVLDQGLELYCTVQQVPAVPRDEESTQFSLRVLDPRGSRAWSAAFTARHVNEMIANEQAMDLCTELISTAVAVCVTSNLVSVHWGGPGGCSLRFECWFDTLSQSAIPAPHADDRHMLPRAVKFKLPPSGAMQQQEGEAFSSINTGVLSSLMHQHSQLQQHQQLLESKLSQLQQHTQAVHDSYSQLISKLERGELSLELGGLVGLSRVGSSPATKKQRTGHDAAAPGATQQAPLAGSPLYGARHPPADSLSPIATQQGPFGSTLAQTAGGMGSQGTGLAGCSQYDAAGDAVAGAGTSGVAYNRRQRQQQQTRQEAVKQKLLSEHRQLQQEWQGRLQQLLQAEDLHHVQHLLAEQDRPGLQDKGPGRQTSGKPSGELAPGRSGMLNSSQPHQQEQQHKRLVPEATPATTPAAADQITGSTTVIDEGMPDLLADDEDDVPELTAATARQVVRRATRHVNPLLAGKRRR